MKEFLATVVQALVEHPGDVRISEVSGEKLSVFELRCHADDIGRIIGKSGSTVGAVRVLLSVVASRSGRRAILEVVD